MRLFLLLFTFILFNAEIFAQDEQKKVEISELAKKNAQAYCNCPSLDLIISISRDLQEKKINIDEYKNGAKLAMAEATECIRPFIKQMKALSPDEYEFFSQETRKYRLEFCAAAIEKKQNINFN